MRTFLVCLLAVAGLELVRIPGLSGRTDLRLDHIALLRFLELGTIALILIRRKETANLGLSRNTLLQGLKQGLVWSCCFGFICLLGAAGCLLLNISFLPELGLAPTRQHDPLVKFILVGGVIGPITEEVFFRGVVFSFLRRWGPIVAISVSTGVFVLAHPQAGSFPLLTHIVGGLLFAVAFEVEKNLSVPITIHVAGNLSLYGVTFLL